MEKSNNYNQNIIMRLLYCVYVICEDFKKIIRLKSLKKKNMRASSVLAVRSRNAQKHRIAFRAW